MCCSTKQLARQNGRIGNVEYVETHGVRGGQEPDDHQLAHPWTQGERARCRLVAARSLRRWRSLARGRRGAFRSRARRNRQSAGMDGILRRIDHRTYRLAVAPDRRSRRRRRPNGCSTRPTGAMSVNALAVLVNVLVEAHRVPQWFLAAVRARADRGWPGVDDGAEGGAGGLIAGRGRRRRAAPIKPRPSKRALARRAFDPGGRCLGKS